MWSFIAVPVWQIEKTQNLLMGDFIYLYLGFLEGVFNVCAVITANMGKSCGWRTLQILGNMINSTLSH